MRLLSKTSRGRTFNGQAVACLTACLLVAIAGGGCVDEAPQRRAAAMIVVDVCSGIPDNALCNDKNTCTTGDRCLGGLCVGALAANGTPCTDGNQCTGPDVCNTGSCVGAPVVEGTVCTDGEPCTGPDTCRGGACTRGPAVVCDDGRACTTDSCVMGVGCRFDVTGICPVPDAAADGVPPVDGLGDAGLSDAVPGVDGEGGMTDADGGSDADGADVPDSGPDAADDGMADGNVSVDAADAAADDVPDASVDGLTDGATITDAKDAGPADTAGDAVAPFFEARGGACSCALSGPPSPTGALVLFGGVALLLGARRRRRQVSPVVPVLPVLGPGHPPQS